MWRIADVSVIRSAGENATSLPCFYFDIEFDSELYCVELRLINSELGKSHVLSGYRFGTAMSNMTYGDFIEEVKRINPYGYTNDDEGHMFTVVDDISYKFLELIKRIRLVRDEDIKKIALPLGAMSGFAFWDKEKSLVDINTWGQHKKAFPIFQAICYAPHCMIDGKYYMWNEAVTKLYCIEFTDIVEAQRYVNKARMSGYAKRMEQGINRTDAFLDIAWS